jgi:hypothetical protein
MAEYKEGINVESHNIFPVMLVDEVSSTEYYIGISKNFNNQSKPNWQIKRIWKVGNVWNFGFPNGNQGFKWIWDIRYDYTYTI